MGLSKYIFEFNKLFSFNFKLEEQNKSIRKELIYEMNNIFNGQELNSKNNILLVPITYDLNLTKLVIKIAYRFAKENKQTIKYFFIHTPIENPIFINSLNFFQKILYKFSNWNFFVKNKLLYTFNIKNQDLLFSNFFYINKDNPINYYRYKKDILEIKHNEIKIGDLIYDTYLRYLAVPTINKDDPKLHLIIDYSKKMISMIEDIYSENNIEALILPYLSYIQWGIPARVALKNNIKVYSTGSAFYFLAEVNKNYPYHTKNYQIYSTLFKYCLDKDLKIKQANEILQSRLSGKVDEGIYYLKESIYSRNNYSFTNFNNNRFIIIFLHCFFDSPHIYGNGVFVDFFEWVEYLLDKALKMPEINFIFKEHPNGLPENKKILSFFKNKYERINNIIFIDGKISNYEIAKMKPLAALTYYGTVAHEFSFLKIPVINAGENPHSLFNFSYNILEFEEYDNLITNIENIELPKEYNIDEIGEFFYMHYLYYSNNFDFSNLKFEKNYQNGNLLINNDIKLNNLIFK